MFPPCGIDQARRMLQDDRVRGLAVEFAGNWLDFRHFDDVPRRTVRYLASRHKNDQTLRKARDRAHDVFNHDHGDTFGIESKKQFQNRIHFGMGKSCHGLVGDEQSRLCCHGSRQIEFS